MSTATLCLGANTADAEVRIEQAVRFITGIVSVTGDSGPYPSDPEKNVAAPAYTNRILLIETSLPCAELHRLCKEYESSVRSAAPTPGRVTIDIDIVIFDTTILRPLDNTSAYFRKGLALLQSALR